MNHNGELAVAKKLVDAAQKAGADAIKFQTFKTENLVTGYAVKADYQKTDNNESQYEMLKKLELRYSDFEELNDYCKKQNITFLSSPFDMESIDFLNSLDMLIFKIPSGEITNLPYLKKIGGLKKRVILSTGMSSLAEIKDALDVLLSAGAKKADITLLHCNTEYPTSMEDVNLLAMLTIKNEFGAKVGYSDHTLGVEVPAAAVALGAVVIEKHFTLDKGMSGPDHKTSLDVNEFETMVSVIRNLELALGCGLKKPTKSELKNISVVRKSIVASRCIMEGEIFTENNLTVKRPGIGMSPMYWNEIIGQRAKKDFAVDEIIKI